jgi:octaprenyl-diphosphate synthase
MTTTSTDTRRSADYAAVRALAAGDMQRVDTLIRARLSSGVVLINQIADHIIASGGKRLRPMLHVLAAGAAGYHGDQHIKLAAVIEFIHTSTLLHDDVVDESDLRRGRKTANALWGNAASVLVGDFLYSRAFQLMVTAENLRVFQILADATNIIAEGEVLQLLNSGNPDVDERRYLDVIQRKTAKLFEAAAQLGAVLSDAEASLEGALARYGMHLGTAFQLIDDVLDYTGDHSAIGKNLGDDLAEGKPTLPLIRALSVGSHDEVRLIRSAIEGRRVEDFQPVLAALQRTGSLDYTRRYAEEESKRAASCLATLAPSTYRETLLELCAFAVTRTF